MAMVEIQQQNNRIRYPEIDTSNLNLSSSGSTRSQIMGELEVPKTTPYLALQDDVMFVALGKDVKEGATVLMWALHNSRGKKIFILHVHQPAQKMPMMGGKVSISLVDEDQVKAYHAKERLEMHKILDKYTRTCDRAGVRAEKLYIEMDSIEKGIVRLITEQGIKWLVMGAAANKHYSRKMKEPRSKKATHVCAEAPSSCHIWFICKGSLIHTRESKVQESPNAKEVAHSLRSRSGAEGESNQMGLRSTGFNNRMFSSEEPPNGFAWMSPESSLNREGNSDWDSLSRGSPSVNSRISTCSSSEIIENSSALITVPCTQENEIGSGSPIASTAIEGNTNDELYDRIEQFMVEAENSRKEAYEESIRRKKAEKDGIDFIRRAKASEVLYVEELRRRKESEEALARDRKETERLQWELNGIMEELRVAQDQKYSLECQIADSDRMVDELEQKMFSAVDLLQKYKQERDELQVDLDNALKVAEELRKKQAEVASSSSKSQFFSEFFYWEIEGATSNFSQSLKIGQGVYGSIYRGNLRHTQVVIKMLHSDTLQGPYEYQHEVSILSKLRHPNIVTLIGACPEAWSLIYEYLPNGNLEDRLNCKNNTPPLSWKTRIRIAAELCSALIFLHSCRPNGIVHGDLNPGSILLDENFVSKLSHFGVSRELNKDKTSDNNTTLCHRADPKGTFIYIDPEFLLTGELTPKSDVYSFGVILLRLLTGRPAIGLTNDVQVALDKGTLKEVLDAAAGDWPFVQAKQLAHLALSCADMNSGFRPDLASEVWRVLEPMKVSCGVTSLRFGSEESHHIPAYFVCPIFQEIMQDPVLAADGFTYESEALKGWLESGHDTSPMTNLKLPNCNLVPNHALRSAIQEWLQQS
ncbi:hypothetical protein ABFS82_02G163900 [Erythranthe guttata]